MSGIKPFQVFNVLSEEDFQKVLVEKRKYITQDVGASTTIHLNASYNEQRIGVFSTLCDKLRLVLTEKNLIDPKVISIDFLSQVQRTKMKFHKHIFNPDIDPYSEHNPTPDPKNLFAVPYDYFWVAVYYPHDVYDKKHYGELIVSRDGIQEEQIFEAIPNSVVFHNAHYGHAVKIQEYNPKYFRDSCFTHWLCGRPG